MDDTLHGAGTRAGSGAAAEDPFVVAPTLDSDAAVRAALDVWADVCLNLSMPELAADLLEAATAGRPTEETALRRAVYLVVAGRFAEARDVLPAPYQDLPHDPSDVRLGHLVQAAADAALGVEGALTWLTSIAVPLLHSDAAELHAVCLARVGDALGDHRLADAAYRQLGHLGFLNRTTTPRSAALVMLDRDRSDLDSAQQTLNEALEMVQGCSQSLATDPEPLLQTAAELVARGDRAGAMLLLKWATRTDPRGRRVKEAFQPLSPARVGPARALLLGVLWLVFAVVAGYGIWHHTPAALLPLAGGVALWNRYVPLPGLSLVDSRLYRRLRPIQATPVTREETVRYSIVGVVTVAFSVMWAFVALAAIGSRTGVAWDRLPLWTTVLVWTVAMGVVPGLVTLGLWRSRRRRLAREEEQRRLATKHDLVAAGARCRCWTTPILLGSEAESYLDHHLHPVELPAAMASVAVAHAGRALQTAYCGRTGAAWLRVTVAAEGAAYLLRGPLGDARRAHDRGAAEASTGFYL